ncbi:hypothetical protein A7K91_14645 [Paenibacillus oryzae]|uniref:Uncharacterized protein n=1 Tax=Paenibacillus oryzae TaxID=1844972 RepID=A0A1A5YSA7_9BACL|nr:hypothetical protein [Paenibacillus oryzae]OBR68300.1 hypothetical protein A7K91_14645 [Paenibacillus oryzae]
MKKWLGRLTWAICITLMFVFLLLGNSFFKFMGNESVQVKEITLMEQTEVKKEDPSEYTGYTTEHQILEAESILKKGNVEHDGIFRDKQGIVLQFADVDNYKWALDEFSDVKFVKVIQVENSLHDLEEAKSLVLKEAGIKEVGDWLLDGENRLLILADNEDDYIRLSQTITKLGLSELIEASYIAERIDQSSAA